MPGTTELDTLFKESPDLDINVHEYNINVTSNDGLLLSAEEVLEEFRRFDGASRPTHLYFHLPLCDYICHFCNYVKKLVHAKNRIAELDTWTSNLIADSRFYLESFDWVNQAKIKSFYIGGGTGALLLQHPDAARRLVGFVNSSYNMTECVERSIEGNPENFTTETVQLAAELGFNRFSVGVQSLQDEVNGFANRKHSSSEAIRAVKLLSSSGYPFSVDLMFGLPHQTVQSATNDVQRLVELNVPAITIYRLRNSERERMGIGNASVWNQEKVKEKLDSNHLLPVVSETYAMRDSIVDVLLANDYHPSPCGWWNKSGLYPEGNIPRVSKDKWEFYNTMLGYGPGAYGWLVGLNGKAVQLHNVTSIQDYNSMMNREPPVPGLAFGRLLEGNRAIGTRLGFGFKANQPIALELYRKLYGVDLLTDMPYRAVFEELLEKKFMVTVGDPITALKPTLKGEMVHEEIMFKYFHQRIGGSLLSGCMTSAGSEQGDGCEDASIS